MRIVSKSHMVYRRLPDLRSGRTCTIRGKEYQMINNLIFEQVYEVSYNLFGDPVMQLTGRVPAYVLIGDRLYYFDDEYRRRFERRHDITMSELFDPPAYTP